MNMHVVHELKPPPSEYDHLEGDGEHAWWALPLIGVVSICLWAFILHKAVEAIFGN